MANGTELINFPEGGYRYLKGVFQYSGGVAAQPGHLIERVLFKRPMPLTEGFEAIAAHLVSMGRPLTALCACELRSPAPFSEAGFEIFNRRYARTLESWGLVRGDRNPVARTNVCPLVNIPAEPVFHAFCYTFQTTETSSSGDFVVSGGGEARDGQASYRESMVRLGDISLAGLREKLHYVMTEMERRTTGLGFDWDDATVVQVYTVHDIGSLVEDEIIRRGNLSGGLTWHLTRPPIVDMEVEMDLRRVRSEILWSPRP